MCRFHVRCLAWPLGHPRRDRDAETGRFVALPGEDDLRFLLSLRWLAERQVDNSADNAHYSATPNLYSLWILTSHVTVDPFADAVNESGCLPGYC